MVPNSDMDNNFPNSYFCLKRFTILWSLQMESELKLYSDTCQQ